MGQANSSPSWCSGRERDFISPDGGRDESQGLRPLAELAFPGFRDQDDGDTKFQVARQLWKDDDDDDTKLPVMRPLRKAPKPLSEEEAARRSAAEADGEARWQATKAAWEAQVREAIEREAEAEAARIDALAAEAEAAPEVDERLAAMALLQRELREEEEQRCAASEAAAAAAEAAAAAATGSHAPTLSAGGVGAAPRLDRASLEVEAHWRALKAASKLPPCEEEETSTEAGTERAPPEGPPPEEAPRSGAAAPGEEAALAAVPAASTLDFLAPAAHSEEAAAGVAVPPMLGQTSLCTAPDSPSAARGRGEESEKENVSASRNSQSGSSMPSKAATGGAAGMVEAFLKKHGFREVNSRRRRRLRTSCPLHVAAAQGDADILASLLEARADLALRNSAGLTAADVAKRKGHDDCLTVLEKSASKCMEGS